MLYDCFFEFFHLTFRSLLLKLTQITKLQDALTSIKGGHVPNESMPSFEEIKEIVGFNHYYEEEKRYATIRSSSGQLSSQRGERDLTLLLLKIKRVAIRGENMGC